MALMRRKKNTPLRLLSLSSSFQVSLYRFRLTIYVICVCREQMYKKRFSKWGFHKNAKRPSVATTVRPLKKKDACKGAASREASSMPALLKLDHRDGPMLMFLTSVRTWSVAFFESVRYRDGLLVSGQPQRPTYQQHLYDTKEANFAFKLVIDLLDRGCGDLAGRMARKAFLLVEDMLMLEGPVLVWNLLEIMHYMVTLGHVRLFSMLLAHIIALANGKLPENHPLLALLRGLRGLVASITSLSIISAPRTSPPSLSYSVQSSSTRSEDENTTSLAPEILSSTLPSLLERAWTLNAEILFDHLDSRLFQFYFSMLWESCSIGPPASFVGAGDQWASQIAVQPMIDATTVPEELRANIFVEEDRMTQCLLSPRMDASPPLDYEMLRTSSLATLRECGDAIFSKGPSFNGDTTKLLGMMAGLGTAKALEGSPPVLERSDTADYATILLARIHAGNVACVIRALMDLDTEHSVGGPSGSLNSVERIRAVVALREYANGETDPQVVREMWLFQDALVAVGEHDEAQKVERNAHCRIEKYISDIPLSK